MLKEETIKTILFTLLFICFIFYLFMGIYSYKRDNKSKTNIIFLWLCVCTSIWALGYAFMLISPNIEQANIWRIIASLGWCFFNAIWISFAFTFKDLNKQKYDFLIKRLLYTASIVFFVSDSLFQSPKIVNSLPYGFVDNLHTDNLIDTMFNIYMVISFIAGLVILYFSAKASKKNRIKRQMKIIFVTCLISFLLTLLSDFIFPVLDIEIFPYGAAFVSIGMVGMWYAINKYKMMSISYKFISKYIFEAVNEPIFILGEDFLVKNCNKAAFNLTGYTYKDLKHTSLDEIVDLKNFNFDTIMQSEKISNIEVNLHINNKEHLVYELSATVIHDEYKDVLGIAILLHDVNDRLLAETQLRHLIYYDALTELSNRKKFLEDIDLLVSDPNKKFAVLFIDLDNFKSINDNYGHQVGDHVLKAVASRLKDIVSPKDTISRIGGDEFTILLKDIPSYEKVEDIVATIVKVVNSPFLNNSIELFIGASVGVSIFPDHGADADTLIKNSDLAMYEVKSNGGYGFSIYSSDMKSWNSKL